MFSTTKRIKTIQSNSFNYHSQCSWMWDREVYLCFELNRIKVIKYKSFAGANDCVHHTKRSKSRGCSVSIWFMTEPLGFTHLRLASERGVGRREREEGVGGSGEMLPLNWWKVCQNAEIFFLWIIINELILQKKVFQKHIHLYIHILFSKILDSSW